MIYRPYFNKPSHAIEWFTDLQLKDINKKYGHFFNRKFPNSTDKKLIFKQWEKLIECKLTSIDKKGFNYINSLHKTYRDRILNESYLRKSVFAITDEELINAKTFYHSLSKLSWLLFSLYNPINVNRRGCSYFIRAGNGYVEACNHELRRRIIFRSITNIENLYARLPLLESCHIAFGVEDASKYLLERGEAATKGLFMPGEPQNISKKLDTNSDSETALISILNDYILKTWIRIIKENKIDEALLGNYKDIFGFKTAIKGDMINKIESKAAKNAGLTIRKLREKRNNLKSNSEKGFDSADNLSPIYKFENNNYETYYTNEELDHSDEVQNAKVKLIEIFNKEKEQLRYNSFASRQIITAMNNELEKDDFDLSPKYIAISAKTTKKTVINLYKNICTKHTNLKSILLN